MRNHSSKFCRWCTIRHCTEPKILSKQLQLMLCVGFKKFYYNSIKLFLIGINRPRTPEWILTFEILAIRATTIIVLFLPTLSEIVPAARTPGKSPIMVPVLKSLTFFSLPQISSKWVRIVPVVQFELNLKFPHWVQFLAQGSTCSNTVWPLTSIQSKPSEG